MTFDYRKARYWYHLSYDLSDEEITLYPKENLFNRAPGEPRGRRLCVAPSIPHCLTACLYGDNHIVYRTKEKVRAKKPHNIYDMEVTHEGWITKPTVFIKIGKINLNKLKSLDKKRPSCLGVASLKKVLAFWKRAIRDKSIQVR